MLNTCVLQPETILTAQLRRALYATRQRAQIRAPKLQRDGDSSDRHEHGLPARNVNCHTRLWQSTLFTGAAALLMQAFRSNAASIRFKILSAASLKFLLPFSCLMLLGEHLHWVTMPAAGASPRWSLAVNQIMRPASLVKLDFGPAAAGPAADDPECP